MAWLEITIPAGAQDVEKLTQGLTCAGFSDLVIEDQGEFEQFLDETGPAGTILTKSFRKNSGDFPRSGCIWRIRTRRDFPGWRISRLPGD